MQAFLDKNEIEYETITDEDIISKVSAKNNITYMPFADIDGKIYKTDDLVKYIRNGGK